MYDVERIEWFRETTDFRAQRRGVFETKPARRAVLPTEQSRELSLGTDREKIAVAGRR